MFIRSIGFAAVLMFVAPCLAGTQTRISAFEYDPATGLLTKEIIEPRRIVGSDPDAANAPNYYPFCLVTAYVYDNGTLNGVGNITSATTRNCNGTGPNDNEAPIP